MDRQTWCTGKPATWVLGGGDGHTLGVWEMEKQPTETSGEMRKGKGIDEYQLLGCLWSILVAKCQANREEYAMGRIHKAGAELNRAGELLV